MTTTEEISKRDRTLSASSDRSDSEADPQFEPIIRLPEVKVSTNEENEEVMLKQRARLYRFDTSNEDGPEWKERGTGEVKILQHRENYSARIVMRRDKTFKVCANHFITPWMELKPSAGSDKAFVYTVAADFADEQAKSECLAIKFGSVEFANQFKEKFNEAKRIVQTKCILYISDHIEEKDADDVESRDDVKTSDSDVSKKLAELSVEEKASTESDK